jgi:hypothetical protein
MDYCIKMQLYYGMEIYQDITGNINSPQPENVSISAGFRTALFHFIQGAADSSTL